MASVVFLYVSHALGPKSNIIIAFKNCALMLHAKSTQNMSRTAVVPGIFQHVVSSSLFYFN